MGLPPNDFEKDSDDFEEMLKQRKKRATVQLILFILLLIVVMLAVFFAISKIMPTADDIRGWLDSLFQTLNHL